MPIVEYKKIRSTSEEAKDMAARGCEPWTVVVAEEQESGHGRKGSAWFSPSGGLYFSIILPQSDIADLQTLTILAAFIVAKTIKENFGLEPMIKLPNDVFINNKKVCGILTENMISGEVKQSIIGIGLNTNISGFPDDLENIATSLELETEKKIDNREILEKIVTGLKDQLKIISQ